MKPLVLITRPQAEADEFADSVKNLGYDTLCEPLLSIEPLSPDINDLDYPALIATSPQALSESLPMDKPLFVMGQASVQKARLLGFKNILSADGDFERLVELIKGNVPTGSRVLYLRGDVTRHEMKAALQGYSVSEQLVYRAVPRLSFSAEATQALAEGRVKIVTIFSPRTASLFQNLVQSEGLRAQMQGINLLCLSSAVLDSIDEFAWARTDVAPSTDSAGMLTVLRNWIGSFT